MTGISTISKIVFVGTPDFAVPTLLKLSKSKYRPLLIITQPDRPQGRKLKIIPPPVKKSGEELGIEVMQPEQINDEDLFQRLTKLAPDIIITAAFGGFLRKRLLQLPRLGCLNLHPSLLPKYRGATPINYALFNGDRETGVTIYQMTRKMDSGPLLSQQKMIIEEKDNYIILSQKLAEQGAEEMLEVLQNLEKGQIISQPQNDEKATYCYKLTKEDLYLDWKEPARKIHNRVRGLADEPGAVTIFRNIQIKVLETEILQEEPDRKAGEVSAVLKNGGIVVCSSDRKILLTRVQSAGKRIMSGYEYHLGARIEIGESFSSGICDRS